MSLSVNYYLGSLNGTNGVQIYINNNYLNDVDYAVSNAGDLNSDGLSDCIINSDAPRQSYVIFGTREYIRSPFNISTLNGHNGFSIFSSNHMYSPINAAAASPLGDVNGDGIDDIVLGFPNQYNLSGTGSCAVVIFGSKTPFTPVFDISSLDGSNGFIVYTSHTDESIGVSVNGQIDINNDGINDILVGNQLAGGFAGAVYVIYGNDTHPAMIDVTNLDGIDGFTIHGHDYTKVGYSVSPAGDFNGDNMQDFIIGSYVADGKGIEKAYLVFGSEETFPQNFYLSSLNGNNGFTISYTLSKCNNNCRSIVSKLGDFNGDGFGDIILGFPDYLRSIYESSGGGKAFILFGDNRDYPAEFNLDKKLNSTMGVDVSGDNIETYNYNSADLGFDVGYVGDYNNDGYDDALMLAPGRYPGGGQAYILFGRSETFTEQFDITTLNGSNGVNFIAEGDNFEHQSIISAKALPNFNGDNITNIVFGVGLSDVETHLEKAYIVYSQPHAFITPSPTPSITSTPSLTSTPSVTPSLTSTSSATPSLTSTPSATPSLTSTSTADQTEDNMAEAELIGVSSAVAGVLAIGGIAFTLYARANGWWCFGEGDTTESTSLL